MPTVSVVIRAKNEGRYLGETLEAIRTQQHRKHEIILVDSGSTDRTVEIASDYGARVLHIRSEEFTYGRALNLGISESSGEVVVSLSAHATPEGPEWLGALVAPFRFPGVAGVYGRHIPRSNVSFFELLGMNAWGMTSREPRFQVGGARFSNANGAIRRAIWEEVPFDETLPGAEDIEWARRAQKMGFAIAYEPRAAVYHSHGESLPRLLLRQLHDQPVILKAWLMGMGGYQPWRRKQRVRSGESIAK